MKKCDRHGCKKTFEAKRKYCSQLCNTFVKANTVSKLKKKVWILKSKQIRRQYADKRGYVKCYTCPSIDLWNSGAMHVGHFKHGYNPGTWLNNKNLRIQCAGCNLYKSGNLAIYSMNLINEYGSDILNELDKSFHSSPTTWSMIALREVYTELYKNKE